MRRLVSALVVTAALAAPLGAQGFPVADPVLERLWRLGMDSSQVAPLAQVLLDSLGPRLTGTPGMRGAQDWLVKTYGAWGVPATLEQYGTWRAWRRGTSHIDLLQPRVRSLEGTLLAWSAGTKKGRPVEGGVVVFPEFADSAAFRRWLPGVKGKFVLVSFPEPTCRPDDHLERYARRETFERLVKQRDSARTAFNNRPWSAGVQPNDLPGILERAGAVGVVTTLWSRGWGVNKIFRGRTELVPTVELSCEDYGLVWRLAERNQGPVLRVAADAEWLGEVPAFNVIATIRGTERPDEYVVLSAHFDSWDGASGATDNGTGTVMMLEAMRLLRLAYPAPKRTIVVGHWGGEEQGLNGSRGWMAAHPEVVAGLQALFNQDNGTGRVRRISTEGLVHAGEAFGRWLARLPTALTDSLQLAVPGTPSGGGSDNASFICAGAPAFGLGALDWAYGQYTWHTNRDTYDKVVLDDLKQNATLVAMLAYLASEDPERIPRDRRIMPADQRGQPRPWPECVAPVRNWAEYRR